MVICQELPVILRKAGWRIIDLVISGPDFRQSCLSTAMLSGSLDSGHSQSCRNDHTIKMTFPLNRVSPLWKKHKRWLDFGLCDSLCIYSSFKLFLELEPQVRDIIFKFYESKYASCLKMLDEMKVCPRVLVFLSMFCKTVATAFELLRTLS